MANRLGQMVGRVLGIGLFLLLIGVLGYGLWRGSTTPVGTTVIALLSGLASFVVTKTFEFNKQREAAIAEKKRTVYRDLLAPWERILAEAAKGNDTIATLTPEFLATVYSNAFDVVLYGSDKVIQAYSEFRRPVKDRDPLDMVRALANLLSAMREDVTGASSGLPTPVILGTFMNLSDEDVVKFQIRDFVAKNPEKARAIFAAAAQDAAAKASLPPGG